MTKEKSKQHLEKYEDFLGSIDLWREGKNYKHKDVEPIQFTGNLNPSNDLYNLFFIKHKFVNSEEFFQIYCQDHKDELNALFSEIKEATGIRALPFKMGVKYRMYRTYLGITTEYYAYWWCEIYFDNVVAEPFWDKKGVDFKINQNQKTYNIHVYVDTADGRKMRLEKNNNRKSNALEGIHVNFPYSLCKGEFNSTRKLKNGFGVYSEKYMNYLKYQIDNDLISGEVIGIGQDGFIYKS